MKRYEQIIKATEGRATEFDSVDAMHEAMAQAIADEFDRIAADMAEASGTDEFSGYAEELADLMAEFVPSYTVSWRGEYTDCRLFARYAYTVEVDTYRETVEVGGVSVALGSCAARFIDELAAQEYENIRA